MSGIVVKAFLYLITYLFLLLTYLFLCIKEHTLKTSIKNVSKFKIDKITYSKSLSRATYNDNENKPPLYP